MDSNQIVDGLIFYLGLVVLLTFHEFAHAWTAWKCGDDTARLQGRLSLNPLVHIDPIGTVLLPLIMIFASPSIGRFLIGWAKPVPFNPAFLNKRWRDEMLIAMAGPAMNIILAVALVAFARVAVIFNSYAAVELLLQMASLSLVLCFFNLIPIPPLDGSHVLRTVRFHCDHSHPANSAGALRLERAGRRDAGRLDLLLCLSAVVAKFIS
jgi:Zn-dependent protease